MEKHVLVVLLTIASSFCLNIRSNAGNGPALITLNERRTYTYEERKNLTRPPLANRQICSDIGNDFKFDCWPEPGTSESECLARGCCWAPVEGVTNVAATSGKAAPVNIPFCYYPSDYDGYRYSSISDTSFGFTAILQRQFPSPYPDDAATLQMDVRFETDNRLRIRIFDPSNKRFEPPIPVVPETGTAEINRNYQVEPDIFGTGFKVIRTSDNTVIFNTVNAGGLIFADQFIQISSFLPSKYIYGLGEHRDDLLLLSDWKRYTLFTHDTFPHEETNLYGVHPFYMIMEESGNSHGVFLLNSNAMEVILQPAPAITFRTLGGILDFYYFLGPTPSDVVKQYTEVVGRPFMPPYWSLGFQLCRWGYNSANRTREVWQRTRDAGIPFDVQWNDIDYMNHNNDFTYNHEDFVGLPELINDIHDAGMKWIPILDPGVSGAEAPGTYPPYDDGVDMDIFVKNQNGSIFVGKVWNDVSTVYPDFTNPRALEYWQKQLELMRQNLPFDGLWIDMNEPSNFNDGTPEGCPESSLENPPYVVGVDGDILQKKTLCMTAQQYAGRHYDVHNLYGFSETIVTNTALRNILDKRPFIISRSTYSGQGKYGGHWSGDVGSSWYDLEKSIPEILNFNIYGTPMMGVDICGFGGDTTPALCQRWQELGAFYPFSRNHNTIGTIDQDPVALGQEVVDATIKSLTIRYAMLPFLYSLFWDAHTTGSTVARPLFFEFPSDSQTYSVYTQFMWGSALLIVPVVQEGATEREAYIPAGRWFNYYTGAELRSSNLGATLTIPAPLDTIPLYVRGGSVIPMQVPSQTTTESRQNPFELLVALDAAGDASGALYWDEGEIIDTYENGYYNLILFEASGNQLSSTIQNSGYNTPMPLGKVTVLGVNSVASVILQGQEVPFTYDQNNQVLIIADIQDLTLLVPLQLSWTDSKKASV